MAKFEREQAEEEYQYHTLEEAPLLLELEFPSREEAQGHVQYWTSPLFASAADSTFLYPTAIATESNYSEYQEMIYKPRELNISFPWKKVANSGAKQLSSATLVVEHVHRIVSSANVSIYQQRLRDEITALAALKNSIALVDHIAHTGVYVRIESGNIVQFVPFIQWNRKNDWGEWLNSQILRKDGSLDGVLKRYHSLCKWASEETLPKYWMIAGANLGTEDGNGRTVNSRIAEFGHMLAITCKRYKISNCEFVYNKRDLPICPADGISSPQFHLWNNYEKPLPPALQSTRTGAGLAPIISMSTCDGNFADILIPTEDDWRLVTGCAFINNCADPPQKAKELSWNDKIPTAIFRGSATGAGTLAESSSDVNAVNQRLALALFSFNASANPYLNGKADGTNVPFLNAGVTGFNIRLKKSFQTCIDICSPRHLPFNKVPWMDYATQSTYKYLIYVDGHSSANRLGWMLTSKCCILMVASRFRFRGWLHDGLKPHVHYVPVASNLSDLYDKIRWCRDNDASAQIIAENAYAYGQLVLTKDYITGYCAHVLNSIAPPSDSKSSQCV